MAPDVFPSAFFEILEKRHGRKYCSSMHSILSQNKWLNFGYPIPIPGAAFLDLLFLLFSFKKVHDAFAQLRFHCRLPKSQCRSYLILRDETIITSSGHVDLCQILCLKREFVPSLNLHGPDFLNCQVAIAFRQQGGGGLRPGLLQIHLICLFLYQNIRCAIQMDRILRTADWWCLPILSSFRDTKFRLLCLRGSPCNLSESIPEEYQAAPQLAACSHMCS